MVIDRSTAVFLMWWMICGAITAFILIARRWTTVAPWAVRPIYGHTRAWAYVKNWNTLLLLDVAVLAGPLGWLVAAFIWYWARLLDRIGNNGGFR